MPIMFRLVLLLTAVAACSDVLDSESCTDVDRTDLESSDAIALLQNSFEIRRVTNTRYSRAMKYDPSIQSNASSDSRIPPLILLDGYKDAVCLDGSPGGFYFRRGADSKRWILHLEGGGECINEEQCINRTLHRQKGSTPGPIVQGFFSDNPIYNNFGKEFDSWNRILVPYCSADLWTGTQTTPNTTLLGIQFSGHKIVEAVIDYLSDGFALTDAEEVILSGVSAGGAGVWLNLDYVREKLESVPRVVGLATGGYLFPQSEGILEYQGVMAEPPNKSWYVPLSTAAVKSYYELWSSFVPSRCAQQLPESPWMCIFSNVAYRSLGTPIFLSQSQFDSYSIVNHDGVSDSMVKTCGQNISLCHADVVDFANAWRNTFLQQASSLLQSSVDGVFAPACLSHMDFAYPHVDGYTDSDAFSSWYSGGPLPKKLVDTCRGPQCNPTCGPFAWM